MSDPKSGGEGATPTPANDVIVERPLAGAPIRDGIGEEDNEIPLWFNVGFYGLMVYGVAYILFYLFSGWSTEAQYAAEVAVAEERAAAVRATLPTENPFRGDDAAIAAGQEVFSTVCLACHLADGKGLVGPSLVDPYWKYGQDDESLYQTVAEGRPLGMPGWGAQLGSEKIWQVLAYMETLPRSDEPGVGSPEYDAAQAAAAAASDSGAATGTP
ncbi:MAG: c-type cytochrome [Myxococcota bacterium]|nr:c-type cytochrome [Myxococcota bacterium]